MSGTILTLAIACERDTVAARQRARQIAKLLGFEPQDQTRISTAVSEIARNAFNYAGGGRVEYSIEGRTSPQLFIIKIRDSGSGVRDLESILEGRYTSSTGMGMGILGARRLMDKFDIESEPGKGTTIWLKKLLPARSRLWKPSDLPGLAAALAEVPQDAFQELQHQNQELLHALEEIRTRQLELTRLNRELEDTNRGVVALYAELDEKADHLRRADELKSRFLSNMSHEFRSPLNSILALSGLLLDGTDGDLNKEQEQQAVYIRRAARDLLDLVNDLLDLAKVEAGKVEAKPADFRPVDLFAALRGMLRPVLLNQAVELVFEDVSGIPEMFSDEGKISQILRNFISNALKFTERGEVRVSAKRIGNDAVFSVADTGIGIAPDDLGRIFQEFAQVDHPIQRRVKGTGLGLPLSKKLAGLLGGEVQVQSQLGIGSTFTARIPLRYEERVELNQASESAIAAVAANPARIPILVVDDKDEMQMMYRSYLKNSGYDMIFARTIRQAQEVLERIRPRAIILDIVLRSEDSWRFLADLKRDANTQDIPVIVASTVEDQAKAFHLGADQYLLKPVERVPLLEHLQALTGTSLLPRILIIDDEKRDRYVLKQQLGESGLIVQEASNGSDGIRAAKYRPNVIILDLTMPGMNGFEVLDALKTNVATKDIPVVIWTSRVLTEREQSQLETRTVATLSKDGEGLRRIADIVRQVLNSSGVYPSVMSRSA
ncbi:MAG: ATP-binding protein [Bryobacteraceae bacterium]|jgi:signal transduction histidine kinase/CheY-like chemotaxis protein